MSDDSRLYERPLPGGGYVAIESAADVAPPPPGAADPGTVGSPAGNAGPEAASSGAPHPAPEAAPEATPQPASQAASQALPQPPRESTVHAQLLVERRADPGRRVGHPPPVVAETDAPDAQRALDALYAIAANNVEVARALQRWQARRFPSS